MKRGVHKQQLPDVALAEPASSIQGKRPERSLGDLTRMNYEAVEALSPGSIRSAARHPPATVSTMRSEYRGCSITTSVEWRRRALFGAIGGH